MRAKMILICLGLLILTLPFLGKANAALPGEEGKGPTDLHSLLPGDALQIDTTGLVSTSWRQLWQCGNLYHIIGYKDNNDGKLSWCDWIRVELTEAYGQPVTPPCTTWKHVDKVTLTLKLRKMRPPSQDSMFVEFSGLSNSLTGDSLNRALTNPVCTYWNQVWPNPGQWWYINSWKDTGLPSGQLSTCDTIDIIRAENIRWRHVVSVDSLASGFFLKLEKLDNPSDTMRVRFSGGAIPDSVHRARVTPICTWWREEWPTPSIWWHISSWHDNGNLYLNPCDTIDIVKAGTDTTWWHVEDVATDIQVHTGSPVPTMTQWGVIVLVALIVASAVYVMLKRRKAAMPA